MKALSMVYGLKEKRKRIISFVIVLALLFSILPIARQVKADDGKWKEDNSGWWYRNADGTYPADEWLQEGDSWYHFDSDGYMQTGWINEDDTWYFLDDSGEMVTGDVEIDGRMNKFDSDGKWIGYADDLADGDGTTWTVMVYMTGSDLETRGAAATTDMTEMLRSGMDPEKVQVIVATGGAKKWFSEIPNDTVNYYQVSGDVPAMIEQYELSSMGDPATLAGFLDYGYKNFPAEKYALILWDHGGGPMEGVCYDELFNKDSLSLEELDQVLSGSPFSKYEKLEFIGFDACLMGSAETAALCEPYARYMIASEETESSGGWDYRFLGNLNRAGDGAEAGISIIDGYYQSYAEDTDELVTLSCIDLSKISDLEQSVDGLFYYLDEIITPESFSGLSNNRRDARNFGRSTTGSEYDLVDVHSLVQQYQPTSEEAAKQVMEAVENAVIYEKSNLEDTHGLSLYYPYYNKEYFEAKWRDQYTRMGFSEGYRKYLEDYAALWLGEAMVDFTGIEPLAEYNEEINGIDISFTLTPEQEEHFAEAEAVILWPYENGDYTKIWETEDIQNKGDGEYSTDYLYNWMCLTDLYNNKEYAVTFYFIDGSCFIHVILKTDIDENGNIIPNESDYIEQHAWLQCKIDPDTGEVRVVNVIPVDDWNEDPRNLYTGKQVETLDPEKWRIISFPQVLSSNTDYSWPMHGKQEDYEMYGITFNINSVYNWQAGWKLQVYQNVGLGNPDKDIYAYIIIRDTQGNVTVSKEVVFNNPAVPVEEVETLPVETETAPSTWTNEYDEYNGYDGYNEEAYGGYDENENVNVSDIVFDNGGDVIDYTIPEDNGVEYIEEDAWTEEPVIDPTGVPVYPDGSYVPDTPAAPEPSGYFEDDGYYFYNVTDFIFMGSTSPYDYHNSDTDAE